MSKHRLQGRVDEKVKYEQAPNALIDQTVREEIVLLDGERIGPEFSQNFRNHSPCGFAWGYLGSGPAQLALAVLLELWPDDLALFHYQSFKERVIAALPLGEPFDILFDLDTFEYTQAPAHEQ